MKVWEVIRNINKNFTDTLDEAYGNTQKYKNVEKYAGIKKKKRHNGNTNQKTLWLLDVKDY